VIKKVSPEINTVIVDCIEDKIVSILFNGIINTTPKKLADFYGNTTEHFSVRDGLYNYKLAYR
jgi:hypothetical protein